MMRLPVAIQVCGDLRFRLQWTELVLRQVFHGVRGMSGLWAGAWGVGGVVLAAGLLAQMAPSEPVLGFLLAAPAILIVAAALFMIVGSVCGLLFSILLALFERGRQVAELS